MNDEDPQPRPRSIPLHGWKIRFDAPPLVGLVRRAASGDILSMFRAWDGADRGRAERRLTTRYTPAEIRAWVGWWRRGHFLITRGELVNLSHGGALMNLTQQPPTSVPVWICLGAPHPLHYVQARVLDTRLVPPLPLAISERFTRTDEVDADADAEVEIEATTPAPSLPYMTRLEFHTPCPPTFFIAAGSRPDASALP